MTEPNERRLVPKRAPAPRSPGWKGEMQWTVDRESWLSGKTSAFEPSDGVVHVHDFLTGASFDIPSSKRTEDDSPALALDRDCIEAEYHEVRPEAGWTET